MDRSLDIQSIAPAAPTSFLKALVTDNIFLRYLPPDLTLSGARRTSGILKRSQWRRLWQQQRTRAMCGISGLIIANCWESLSIICAPLPATHFKPCRSIHHTLGGPLSRPASFWDTTYGSGGLQVGIYFLCPVNEVSISKSFQRLRMELLECSL